MADEPLVHVEIIWPDGGMTAAGSWRELETNIRIAQWRPFVSRQDFRKEMAARARAWSGEVVATDGTSREFLTRLAAAGLFLVAAVEADGEEVK